MKIHIMALAAGTALSLAACGKHDNANDNMAGADANLMIDNGADANAMAPAADPTTVQGFVNAAAASDRFEIESSKLAQASASSAAVKKFAGQMVDAHTTSTSTLKSLIGGMTPPVTPDDTLNAQQQQTLDSLKGQSGAAFDTAYAQAQVDAHQKALDMLKNYAASGDNPKLKGFAETMTPKVAAHLNLAKGLK